MQSGSTGSTVCTEYASNTIGSSTEVTNFLDRMPELTGSTRDKLLSAVQKPELRRIVDQLYRPSAAVGDGGTASKLMQEFLEGSFEFNIEAGFEAGYSLTDLLPISLPKGLVIDFTITGIPII